MSHCSSNFQMGELGEDLCSDMKFKCSAVKIRVNFERLNDKNSGWVALRFLKTLIELFKSSEVVIQREILIKGELFCISGVF